jgi:hypothetical protein
MSKAVFQDEQSLFANKLWTVITRQAAKRMDIFALLSRGENYQYDSLTFIPCTPNLKGNACFARVTKIDFNEENCFFDSVY